MYADGGVPKPMRTERPKIDHFWIQPLSAYAGVLASLCRPLPAVTAAPTRARLATALVISLDIKRAASFRYTISMDRIIQKLQELLDEHPDSGAVRDAYAQVLESHSSESYNPQVSWDAVRRTCTKLEAEGIWIRSTENDAFLEQVRADLFGGSSTLAGAIAPGTDSSPTAQSQDQHNTGSAEKISVVSIPPVPSFLNALSVTTRLPAELLDVLNQTYFLHVLATNAAKVLPPGKSLLSVMSNANNLNDDDEKSTLESRVEDLVHRAFWDEVSLRVKNKSFLRTKSDQS